MVGAAVSEQDIEAFIVRWSDGEGGAERANYQLFLSELCDTLGVERPRPAGATAAANDYVFERAVRPRESEGRSAPRRIDLYKRGCFILEAKQSRGAGGTGEEADPSATRKGRPRSIGQGDLFEAGMPNRARGWDAVMVAARRQAEDYVFRLDSDHPAPPFIIVCDVGRCLELYADFSGSGRAYDQFPDRGGFRIRLPDLRKPEVRAMLAAIWTDPGSLDPTRKAAQVTRVVAEQLAGVSRDMEARGCRAEDVAQFLMRCVFTMFAEDVDLLPAGSFTGLLEKSLIDPAHFSHRLKALWSAMETGEDFCFAIEAAVRHFNGGLFERTTVFELRPNEISRLLEAARTDWRGVEPAIFGALLEQALDPGERRKLGAHYTPRAYVERLVEATVMEPLRQDWARVLYVAEPAAEGDSARALAEIRDFHRRLREIRVLDPACGTGNFLYVAFDMMKKLEGEVIQRLIDLGEAAPAPVIPDGVVGPGQFLGMEVNERAAHIAELVVWIGYLQWRARASTDPPAEPILMALKSIRRMDAVMTSSRGLTPTFERHGGEVVEVHHDPRRPEWPAADFIVGNPPFMGGKDLRARLGDAYAEALWAAHPDMNESADLVMYWWNETARRLADADDPLRRFGLVTTNSISQVFQRRVVERWLNAASPISLALAIPDHPWTRVGRGAAAVRIAMTVAQAGRADGVLKEVEAETGLETDTPVIVFRDGHGRINADLTVGADVTRAKGLMANMGLCSPGMKLHGAGFIVAEEQARSLGLGRISGLDQHIRPYRNGRDLMARSRDLFVIDFFGLTEAEVRARYPEACQHLLERVKPERDRNNRAAYRDSWWIFGEPRSDLRPALLGCQRYLSTVETAKHRVFQFLDASVIPDNKLICIADADAFTLGVLSSQIHGVWTRAAGGWLGAGNDSVYVKSKVFDPFPFPEAGPAQRAVIAEAAEELDATRKRVLAVHPDLTLTGLYNGLEALRAGVELSPAERDVQKRGQILILKRLHEIIDAAVADAYGWPADLDEQAMLERILTLNAERAALEAQGVVAWLRPEYQAPRFGKGAFAVAHAGVDTTAAKQPTLPLFPTRRDAQPLAVMDALFRAGAPLSVAAIAAGFRKGGPRIETRVREVLAVLSRYGHVTNPANDVYEMRLRA